MQVVCTNFYLYSSNFREVITKSFRGPVFFKHSVHIYCKNNLNIILFCFVLLLSTLQLFDV